MLMRFCTLFAGLMSLTFASLLAQPQLPATTVQLLEHLIETQAEEPLEAFTFVQQTIRYKDGVPSDTSTWYEAIQYPDKFRIGFGEKENQSFNLYRNDSLYAMRKGEWVRKEKHIQEFLILEGGLYTLPLDTILARLEAIGIAIDRYHLEHYEGRMTYVIGAEKGDLTSPQIWIDAERKRMVRRFSRTGQGKLMEIHCERFQQYEGKYWIETWLEFYVEGELLQTELYEHIKVNPELDQRIWSPTAAVEHYWY